TAVDHGGEQGAHAGKHPRPEEFSAMQLKSTRKVDRFYAQRAAGTKRQSLESWKAAAKSSPGFRIAPPAPETGDKVAAALPP
ncbi:MAG TPA: hypothetical protein VFE33_01395, partial [Thermoanaerobaculia bacterium]|nr:hypothetical protein [Thermoanaerobaculia bacterium]